MKTNGKDSFFKSKFVAFARNYQSLYPATSTMMDFPILSHLCTQARRCVSFINKGNGTFERRSFIISAPVYGSSYFELDDFVVMAFLIYYIPQY